MKRLMWPFLALILISCAPQAKNSVIIIDGEKVITLQPASRTLAALVTQAGLSLAPADKFYVNGSEPAADYVLPDDQSITLQIRRAVDVTLVTPDGQTTFQSAAPTVGQAIAQTGLQLYAEDYLSPPPGTPLDGSVTVAYRPARTLTVSVDGKSITVLSSAQTVGKALAEAGLALLGLDYARPAESEAVPADGQIKIVKVSESVLLQQKSIPYKTDYRLSDTLDLGAQELLKAGQTGLTVSRVRVRLEDGKEVSRVSEAETVVRAAQDRIVSQGTKIALASVPGTNGLQYWRAVSMFATWYSPCHSGGSRCYYGTASGLPVKKGVAAMIPANYNALEGQQIFVPGYGTAIIADVGGGMPDGRLWLDLAYSDDDTSTKVSGWVTVYFLTPVPSNPAYVIQ